MGRRKICPGSYGLAKRNKIEETDSKCSRDGTATHRVAEMAFESEGMLMPVDFVGEIIEGVEITEQLAESPQQYVESVLNTMRDIEGDLSKLCIEAKVDLSWVDDEMFGSADLSYYHEPTKTLYVWDYKNGFDGVEAVGNLQLRYYTLGLLPGLGAQRVVMSIAQPNAGGMKTVEHDVLDALAWIQEFIEIAYNCRLDDALRVAGDYQCKYCESQNICPENRAKVWSLANAVGTPQDIGDEIRALDELIILSKKRREALNNDAYDLMYRHGQSIDGHKLIHGPARRSWVDESQVIALCKQHDVDPYDTPKLKSPNKLEKIIDRLVLKDLISQPEGKIQIVKESQRGTPVTNSIQNCFANVQGGIIKTK